MSTPPSTITELFDQWAPSYDEQPNPLLALEERVLPRLLPRIAGADVLDVGCGTGRWLSRFEELSPASLSGIDPSQAMLEQASKKLAPTTRLYPGDATLLAEEDSSLDLLLASFVLSYVSDLSAFVEQCCRVLRPGGVCLLSDMHPRTAAERGWKRSFRAGDRSVHLPVKDRSLQETIETFERFGLVLSQRMEPDFGDAESTLFEQAGRFEDYLSLIGVPAIYLLRFQKTIVSAPVHDLTITNARWAEDAWSWNPSSLSIQDGTIATRPHSQSAIDLTGYVLLPGLINAHDHLEFALFPNLGRTPEEQPYCNATDWANEIHAAHEAVIAQHLQVPLSTRLWWGAIRNLLCGVTTVCHHNPHHAEFDAPDFPIRVVSDFGWSHSLTFAVNLLDDFPRTPAKQPFLLHAAEGTDVTSREELYELDRLGVLGPETVLVHGLALGEPELALLNERGASLILCPTSNDFLFQRTLDRDLLRMIDRVALGSDSPLTAMGDLLDEVQHLRASGAVDDAALFKMATTGPATILHLDREAGSILLEGRADIIAVSDKRASPAATLAQITYADVELVLIGGVVQVASSTLYQRLPEQHRAGLELLRIESQQRYVRAPIGELCRSAEQVLGQGKIRLGCKEVRCAPSA